MSVTDQAFIRAFDGDVKSSSVAPSLPRKLLSDAAMLQSPADALITHTHHFGGVATASASPEPDRSSNVRMHGAGQGHGAAIHVGMGAAIPAPHAKFSAGATFFPTSITASYAAAIPSTLPPPSAAISNDRSDTASRKLPHADFGLSPKSALSSFALHTPPDSFAKELARPGLEVDAVRWPIVCETILSRHSDRFDRLADQLQGEAQLGCRIVAITGVERGEGRSTLALCLAQRLATEQRSVALIDADFSMPGLIQQLAVRVDRGWETVLWGEKDLWEVTIESITDRLALVPLAMDLSFDQDPPLHRLSSCFDQLAQHYDWVLIDAGPLATESAAAQWLLEPASGVQGIILAHDVRRRGTSRVAAVCLQLADSKLRQLGIAEMFTEEAGGRR
ncbi:MAG TPA: cellulose synthase operon protein YhjQ/BcsQ [Pirellulales bacterium]